MRYNRILYKTFTWSIVSWVTYIIIFFFVFGGVGSGFVVGTGIFLVKLGLYYLHEHIWRRLK